MVSSAIMWSIYEINLAASRDYANPFPDEPLLKVTFTHADSGEKIAVEGFWGGEESWRVRFTPICVGRWNWNSVSTE